MNRLARAALVCAALPAWACADGVGPDDMRHYVALATGAEHSCAIAEDGSAYCWGANTDGQLGTGDRTDAFLPTRVETSVTFTAITAGDAHTCALADDGRAYCWGWNNYYQLGITSGADGSVPLLVETADRFSALSAGAHHTCGLTLAGLVLCWGYNRYGQIGNGKSGDAIRPEPVVDSLAATAVTAGGYHTCAIDAARVAHCWGRNDYGQLGSGVAALTAIEPTRVNTALRFGEIDAGETHTCGIAAAAAYCWGSAVHGEIGDAAPFRPGLPGPSTPTKVLLLTNVSLVAAGAGQSCAVAREGSFCWGRGSSGQLGNGDTRDQSVAGGVFLKPKSPLPFDVLAPGGTTHACGLDEGTVYCWGTGERGQLGAADATFSVLPQRTRSR